MGSKTLRLFRRAAAAALISALAASGAAVLTAAPASASQVVTLPVSTWSYIDSAAPKSSFVKPTGNAPVGAHTYANGTNHVSKSYVTFDLSSLHGHRLLSAVLVDGETAVTDCANPRATELWLTDPAKKPTWNNQPAELVKAGGPYLDDSCPARDVGWNALAGLQNALDAGRTTATFVLRLPDDQQNDPRFGREYDPAAHIQVNYNQAPGEPTQLAVNGKPCSARPQLVGAGSTSLSAAVTDPDDSSVSAEFALWPVDHPDQRTTIPSSGSATVSVYDVNQYVTEGVAYAWQVRSKDYLDFSPWSAVCQFSADRTSPTAPPTVTSPDYTNTYPGTGGTGIPGSFTFSANGDKDVTGFRYGKSFATTYVAADHRGGTATIRYTPENSGMGESIVVSSVDAAGNSSSLTRYEFWVASNQPVVTCTPYFGFVGEQRQCTFSPGSSTAVAAYVYALDGDSDRTVAPGPDGTLTVTVTPTDPQVEFYAVTVRSKLVNGYTTASSQANFDADPGAPEISRPAGQPAVGTPLDFGVHVKLPGSVSFTYRWNDGDEITIPVGEDGIATVTATPTASGLNALAGYSTTGAGQKSGRGTGNVYVPASAG